MKDADLLKLMFDDVRARQKAVLDLILWQDQQAMGLLRLYVTLGTATASGVAATINTNDRFALGVGLLSGTVMLIFGAICCFRASWQAKIAYPGREPSYWKWFFDPRVPLNLARDGYLDVEQGKINVNHELNANIAREIWVAKWFGAAAPIVTLVVGALAAAKGVHS